MSADRQTSDTGNIGNTAELAAWAARLAAAAVPDEVELAPSMVLAYVAGGRERAELFRVDGSTSSGFDPDGLVVVFPWILAALPGAGRGLWNLVDRHADAAPAVGALRILRAADPELDQVLGTLDARFAEAGVPLAEREPLALRTTWALLADAGGTRAFLTAAGPA
ncbi:hypothetical protein [Actinokineospora enzanensis]|uniref:hypothetical protein n=1 Tax=Actinokineospora enzanensis TaxID=155975 RepID=UPI00035E6CA6|nr:hypothetical protein [Actinokineospora enzanensis]